MRFYSTEELSPRQAVLPSGTLWLRDVVLARTGVQRYHLLELPDDITDSADADSDGMIDVVRDATDVFDEVSMASFEGAPVTLGHPIDPVGPTNWSALSVGHAANVHRAGDLLVADLLISDQRGIRAIRERNYRGISAGYDAAYQAIGDGRLRQFDITGNHIALLSPHEEARCGDLCRVGDAAKKGKTMTKSVLKMTDSEFDAALAKLRDKWQQKPKLKKQQQPQQRLIATTADRMRLMQDREAAQQDRMKLIAQRTREFWSSANG